MQDANEVSGGITHTSLRGVCPSALVVICYPSNSSQTVMMVETSGGRSTCTITHKYSIFLFLNERSTLQVLKITTAISIPCSLICCSTRNNDQVRIKHSQERYPTPGSLNQSRAVTHTTGNQHSICSRRRPATLAATELLGEITHSP